jgi:hypothetical protein
MAQSDQASISAAGESPLVSWASPACSVRSSASTLSSIQILDLIANGVEVWALGRAGRLIDVKVSQRRSPRLRQPG